MWKSWRLLTARMNPPAALGAVGHEATETGLAYAPVSQAHGHNHIVQLGGGGSNRSSGQAGGWNAAGGRGSASEGYKLGAQTSKWVRTLVAPPAPASASNRRDPTTAASWNAVAYRKAVPTLRHRPRQRKNCI